jgi:RNA polymerase sigma factor (sigma-70 family)
MSDFSNSVILYQACLADGTDSQIDAFEVLWSHLYRIAYAMVHARPNGEALANDCTQLALIKVHRSLDQCRNPAVFREWAAQILRRTVLDELRRPDHRLLVTLPDDDHAPWVADSEILTSSADLAALLHYAIAHGPLSERSQRVVAGRYFADQPDEELARVESELAGREVLPSHVQVTRAKNLAALRRDTALMERLRGFLD